MNKYVKEAQIKGVQSYLRGERDLLVNYEQRLDRLECIMKQMLSEYGKDKKSLYKDFTTWFK